MEGYTEQRIDETAGGQSEAEVCECVNYYPGMLADVEDERLERQEILYEQEFFGGAQCFEVAES